MILGAFTLFHVVLSLIGLGTGFVVIARTVTAKPSDRWTDVFLWTTLATSLTGFLFPVHQFLPSHGVGILSVIDLTIAFLARTRIQRSVAWRRSFAISCVVALYFNVFVAIAQAFKHIPALEPLAPRQTEPPFLAAQLAALVLFIALGFISTRNARVISIGL